MIDFVKHHLSPLVERYYYINFIPPYKFLGIFNNQYLYLVLFLLLILLFCLRRFRRRTKINLRKMAINLILVFWLLTLAPWFLTEIFWLKSDFFALSTRSIDDRRIRLTRMVFTDESPNGNFYRFLIFCKNTIPPGAKVYLVTSINMNIANKGRLWARYWLYPELQLVDSLPADYVILFNKEINLAGLSGFKYFAEFAPHKFILKTKK